MRQLILAISMITLSVLLSVSVLLQQRGSGLGMAFGGDSNVFRTKRGLEKGLFYATIALGIVFMATAVLNLLVA
ncbi:preprotein translocase subunit SecG [Candidatus Uhrbacteria bacterium]|jgi:preprotein translocase subunit SecG|nr:preprotein translocase subunit SecG [Candidatus Uhrbacteria bacterium]